MASSKEIVQAVVNALTIEIEASGRHVHLTVEATQALFGPGHRLTAVRPLSQPGQFVCAERVDVIGPKGSFQNVAILGPERKENQVEVSRTDAVTLGLKPPVRQSGDLHGSCSVILRANGRELKLENGLIIAQRHVHLTPRDAERFGVRDGEVLGLKCLTDRPAVLMDTVARVSDKFATYVHLDYDEANACGWAKGDRGRLV
jgi:propanediol utilization protein